MSRQARAIELDVRVDSELWNDAKETEAVVRRAIARTAATLSLEKAEIAVVLTDDSTVRALNRRWRGLDRATNVLSFPVNHAAGEPPLLGDIVLAYQTIAREARAQGKPFAHHLAHLAVHGYLHLVGYDHEDDKDAEQMEAAERKILRLLAIPDPYRRIQRSKRSPKRRRSGK